MRLEIGTPALAGNQRTAAGIRDGLASRGWVALNLISSPGSGKTTLLEATLPLLAERQPVAVIDGDVETDRDAERLARLGIRAVQVETGGACHLDARMVERALAALSLDAGPAAAPGLLFIENVGNLVCPAEYDLGESLRVVLLSTPEGCDKVAKYPEVFRTADLLLVTKIDLAPYTDWQTERVRQDLQALNPRLPLLEVSARTGEGMEAWLAWIESRTARI